MAQPKEKPPSDIKTRTPQKKTPTGIFDNLRSLPHPVEELLGLTSSEQLDTVSQHDTVSKNDTVLPNDRASKNDTVSPSTPVPQPTRSRKTTLYRGDTVPQHDTVSKNNTVSPNDRVLSLSYGFLEVPHSISDQLAPSLKPNEWAVYFQLYRLSHGWGKDECLIGYKRLIERTNIKKTALRETLESLIQQHLIEELEVVNTKDVKGTRYRIYTHRLSDTVSDGDTVSENNTVPPSEPNKRHDHDLIKKDHHQGSTPSIIEIATMTSYQELTGNSWTKADQQTLLTIATEIASIAHDELFPLMQTIAQRSSAPIGSFKFFATAIKNELAEKPFLSQQALRQKYELCAQELSHKFVGKQWESESEKMFEFKRIVLRQLLPWKDDLANMIMATN